MPPTSWRPPTPRCTWRRQRAGTGSRATVSRSTPPDLPQPVGAGTGSTDGPTDGDTHGGYSPSVSALQPTTQLLRASQVNLASAVCPCALLSSWRVQVNRYPLAAPEPPV